MGTEIMSNSQRPVILKQGNYTKQSLAEWKDRLKIWQEIDLYKEQLEELFEIDNPEKIHQSDIHDSVKGFVDKHASEEHGDWVYYPWSGLLIHTVTEDDYFRLRTNRNQNIITAAEQ